MNFVVTATRTERRSCSVLLSVTAGLAILDTVRYIHEMINAHLRIRYLVVH